MKHVPKVLVIALLASGSAASTAAAEDRTLESAIEDATPAGIEERRATNGSAGFLMELPAALGGPDRQELSGCTAEAFCIHTPPVSVFCSAPSGTCTSSGAGCGQVTCNGVTKKCPGSCVGDHHCGVYCGLFEFPNSYCDFGCCVCVP